MKPLIAGFGEIMLRLSPEGFYRLGQSLPGTLRASFDGGRVGVYFAEVESLARGNAAGRVSR